MRRLGLKEEESDGDGFGRTVVVGVKLDALSQELLTWALVKVAEPGDRFIAVHVLHSSELLDKEGKSSLVSLVKASESIISVYEGFCNLKQIDLKFKICRGSSVRKALVQEAKSCGAHVVVVGMAEKSCRLGSAASIAKYCARKLPQECWVVAVSHGRVGFQRESTAFCSLTVSRDSEDLCHWTFDLLGTLGCTRNKNAKVFNGGSSEQALAVEDSNKDELEVSSQDSKSDSSERTPLLCCSICKPDSVSQKEITSYEGQKPNALLHWESMGEASDDSLALVPLKASSSETTLSSNSILGQKLTDLKKGWPLLHSSIISGWQTSENPINRDISVVQWAMQLPTRYITMVDNDHKPSNRELISTNLNANVLQGSADLDAESESTASSENAEIMMVVKQLESLHKKYSPKCRLLSYRELKSATSNFSLDKLIGKGGNSKVYKGHLHDGGELAVKILKPSEDAMKEFLSEIEIINTLNHKNVLSLFGFCCEENKLALVTKYMSKGSLQDILHGGKKQTGLSWGKRYEVAVGVASALDYLHNGSAQLVIHRDVKSSNVLLTDDFDPLLSDFGLATWSSKSLAQITCSDVAGTFGYLAPEYFMYGKVSDKVDVYAFGVILLELLSGRKPISNEYPKGQESLVMWAKPILQSGKFLQLLDSRLGDKYDNDQLEKMVLAASLCIRRAPQFRPRISLILKLLQGDDTTLKWARLQVIASEEFDLLYDEASPHSDMQSHRNLALNDVEDDTISICSLEQSVNYITAHKSLEDYLRGRCSRSSSFD